MQLLLTRTAEQNAQFQALLDLDAEVVSLPLMAVEAIPLVPEAKSRILDLDQFDRIIFISKNAVKYGVPLLEQYWPQWPLKLEWLAVGRATAAAMAAYDLSPVFPELASSEGLLALPELGQVSGDKILIVRGVGGRETLKLGLTGRGAEVEYLEVYQRLEIPYAAEQLPSDDRIVALVYSGEAIQHLSQLPGVKPAHYTLIVPSKRLEHLAIDAGFDKVEVANNQEDQSMQEALRLVVERKV